MATAGIDYSLGHEPNSFIGKPEPADTLACVREVVFIDPRVDDVDALISGLQPDLRVILLSARQSAPLQMARALANSRATPCNGLRRMRATRIG